MTMIIKVPDALLRELEAKYFWWPDPAPRSPERIVAQIMRWGTLDTVAVVRLEKGVGHDSLAKVMRSAAAGWFDGPSWSFWRDRLPASDLPPDPPTRDFGL